MSYPAWTEGLGKYDITEELATTKLRSLWGRVRLAWMGFSTKLHLLVVNIWNGLLNRSLEYLDYWPHLCYTHSSGQYGYNNKDGGQ